MEGSGAPAGAIHPAIEPLSFLLGKWRGRGEGGFPTINSFSYGEELHFSHSGKVSNKFHVNSFFFVQMANWVSFVFFVF